MHVEPLGIYSRRFRTLADVPAGSTVALSNNVTNFSRGLRLLQDQGLIRLRPGGDGTYATVNDIADNPKRLNFVEVAPPQLPRTLDDVALSVINGNYALEAGFTPAKDALGLERAEGNPYANVLVTTLALEHDLRIERLSTLLQSGEVAALHPRALPRLGDPRDAHVRYLSNAARITGPAAARCRGPRRRRGAAAGLRLGRRRRWSAALRGPRG